LESRHIEVKLLFHFSVVLGVLIKIVSEELSNDKEMFFVVEEVNQSEKVLAIKVGAVSLNVPQ
jgi:hypothetical protein